MNGTSTVSTGTSGTHKHEITIEIDEAQLTVYADSHLAMLWHVAQANPADGFDNPSAGDLVEHVGREIIRRWLKHIQPEMWHHQGHHYFWNQLRRLATYKPGGPSGSPEWHRGTWVPKVANDDERQAETRPQADTPG